jgi:hypothetical protein
MKLPQRVSTVGLAFSLLTLLPTGSVSGEVKAKGSAKQGVQQYQGVPQYIVSGKPRQLQVFSAGSRLDLELPDLAPDADWVVGVQNTKENERETVSASLVFWEDSDNFPALAGKGIKTKLVSGFTNYPTKKIRATGGTVKLRGLADFDVNSFSLMVHLKVSPETQVHIRSGDREFTSRFPRSSFVVHNGVVIDRQVKGIQSLVGRLLSTKIAASQGGREIGPKLSKLMRTASLRSRLTPVKAAGSSRAAPFAQDLICSLDAINEEETEDCWYISFDISCSGGGKNIQCSFTMSVCGNAEVFVMAVTGGCA